MDLDLVRIILYKSNLDRDYFEARSSSGSPGGTFSSISILKYGLINIFIEPEFNEGD